MKESPRAGADSPQWFYTALDLYGLIQDHYRAPIGSRSQTDCDLAFDQPESALHLVFADPRALEPEEVALMACVGSPRSNGHPTLLGPRARRAFPRRVMRSHVGGEVPQFWTYTLPTSRETYRQAGTRSFSIGERSSVSVVSAPMLSIPSTPNILQSSWSAHRFGNPRGG
jgi:hypothetical protein